MADHFDIAIIGTGRILFSGVEALPESIGSMLLAGGSTATRSTGAGATSSPNTLTSDRISFTPRR